MRSRSPIEQLLISPPGRPDDPAWSAQAHAVDDLMRRAAYYGLMSFFGRTDVPRDRDEAQRQACIDGAKRIAAVWPDYNVEYHVRTWEEVTEHAYKEWCGVHSGEIMQRYYARTRGLRPLGIFLVGPPYLAVLSAARGLQALDTTAAVMRVADNCSV